LVLVPAGIVVVDEMTLADPVLVVQRQLRALVPRAATTPLAPGTVDLRLGATLGTVELCLDESLAVVRSGRGRRPDETVQPSGLVVAVIARRELLDRTSRRHAVERAR
jgi:hypothetical protein